MGSTGAAQHPAEGNIPPSWDGVGERSQPGELRLRSVAPGAREGPAVMLWNVVGMGDADGKCHTMD